MGTWYKRKKNINSAMFNKFTFNQFKKCIAHTFAGVNRKATEINIWF